MKKILLSVLILLTVIQFVRPKKNNVDDGLHDISKVTTLSKNVSTILKTSCYDCHSNKTVYPWYSEIAPMSWFIAGHVNNAKEHLNFSEWAVYNRNQKEHIIKDLKEVMEEKEMPLASYILMHEDAVLSNDQYEILKNWVKTLTITE